MKERDIEIKIRYKDKMIKNEYGFILAETEKAFLIEANCGVQNWIPKSQIKIEKANKKDRTQICSLIIEMPEWLWEKF